MRPLILLALAVLLGILLVLPSGPGHGVLFEEQTVIMPLELEHVRDATQNQGWRVVESHPVGANLYAVRLERSRLRLP